MNGKQKQDFVDSLLQQLEATGLDSEAFAKLQQKAQQLFYEE